MVITNFAVFVRDLRLKKSEILKDMAVRLGVTSAFLSAVENGKKQIPAHWFDKLSKEYKLNKEEKRQLKYAIDTSKDKVIINTKGAPNKSKELAMVFARSFGDLDDKAMDKIKKLLMKGKL